MARKRMLDPGIWFNIQVTRLSVLQRLLYIGLISNADDEGRLNGDPLYLKGVIFPHDQITAKAIEDQLKAIAKQSLIVRYRVNGKWYIQHPNWSKYQFIRDKRASTIPPPPPPTIPPTIPPALKQQQINPVESSSVESKTSQSSPEKPKLGDSEINTTENLRLLLSCGVTKKEAFKIALYIPTRQVAAMCKYAEKMTNPGGAIISAFRYGWAIPMDNPG